MREFTTAPISILDLEKLSKILEAHHIKFPIEEDSWMAEQAKEQDRSPLTYLSGKRFETNFRVSFDQEACKLPAIQQILAQLGQVLPALIGKSTWLQRSCSS